MFGEEFTAPLDPARWVNGRQAGGGLQGAFNPALEGTYIDPANATVTDGTLRLTLAARPTTVWGVAYTYAGACVTTEPSYRLLPGDYVEASIRVPQGDGVWPAFWAVAPGQWPPEIDIFEFFDTNKQGWPRFNYHRLDGTQTGPKAYGTVEYRNSWHTYGLLRGTDGTLTPYLDGVACPAVAVTGADSLSYYLLINLAMYAGRTPPTTVMSVDWVRAWRPA